MSNDLLRCLSQYFSCVQKCDNNWISSCDRLKSTVNDLRIQAKHLRAVSRAEADNMEIFQHPDIHMRLVSKINLAINQTMTEINDEFKLLWIDNQELRNKLSNLEKIRSKMTPNDPDYDNLVKGTPTRPKLHVLLKYATQAYLHHTKVYSMTKESIANLDPLSSESIETLSQLYSENNILRREVHEILISTQDLIKDPRR